MYLSRIELDLVNYKTRRALSSPQVLHAAVENCFPDKEEKDRKLWRLDRLQGKVFLLLLSPEKPDFSLFSKQFCSTGVVGETKDYKPLLSSIRNDDSLRFRLRANPVHSILTDKGERGKVYAHVTTSQKRDWLIEKAHTCGFELNKDLFDVVETDRLRFWRDRKERPVEIEAVVFEGILKVLDTDMFIKTLSQGLGRAKAYGCGLITIARMS